METDKDKDKEEIGSKAVSRKLDRDHDGSILDNLGGGIQSKEDSKEKKKKVTKKKERTSSSSLDRDHDGDILNNLG